MKIAGFDIGGANTDMAIIDFDDSGNINSIKIDFKYLPMWIKNNELGEALKILLKSDINEIDAVGITMTAELVDAYETKKNGVLDIAGKAMDVFKVPVGFLSINGLIDYPHLLDYPENVAAANWIATSKIASEISDECILIDVGSTTTDIIPIKDGMECARGRSDLERLGTGELVYTGTLRTNLATIVQKIPLDDQWYRVSSELFSITADVHRVLNNIKMEDYSCDTPDGAGINIEDCMRRLSRLICGDLDVLTPLDIKDISLYIYQEQIKQIAEALEEVSDRENISNVVATGLGMEILAKKAAEYLRMDYVGMDSILTKEECVVAPAVGTALLMKDYISPDF
ncbi:MAG: hydantoinase/oxoprolinase family protein [Methanobacteriaceae archaeon]|nr:hydantoinase/oxoprolinase family protein [Methanobacteriaceae archaeon]